MAPEIKTLKGICERDLADFWPILSWKSVHGQNIFFENLKEYITLIRKEKTNQGH